MTSKKIFVTSINFFQHFIPKAWQITGILSAPDTKFSFKRVQLSYNHDIVFLKIDQNWSTRINRLCQTKQNLLLNFRHIKWKIDINFVKINFLPQYYGKYRNIDFIHKGWVGPHYYNIWSWQWEMCFDAKWVQPTF